MSKATVCPNCKARHLVIIGELNRISGKKGSILQLSRVISVELTKTTVDLGEFVCKKCGSGFWRIISKVNKGDLNKQEKELLLKDSI